jgi:Ca2+-binding EF-hand superfamily protein
MRNFVNVGVSVLALGLLSGTVARAEERTRDPLPGPIESLKDVQNTGRMLFSLADENNDGQISQKEANDAGNLLVGGFFFRADANEDGTVTQEEAKHARDSFLSQRPWLRYVVETVASSKAARGADNKPNAAQTVADLLDSNNDKKIEASELRQGVKTTVQAIFASADTNRDGQLSPTEVNAALYGAMKAAANAAFDEADTDKNGSISQQEFEKALLQPTRVAFQIIDGNHDGQISKQEAQTARKVIISQVQAMMVPEAPNSPRHLLESGKRSSDVAPVPTFGTPNNSGRAAQPQPAPAQPR